MTGAASAFGSATRAAGEESVFARFAWQLVERGFSVVPIAPGSKKPGEWTREHGWRGMPAWTRFSQRLPTEIELEHWEQWPDAGIGVVLGAVSNLIALDKDYDLPAAGEAALAEVLPYSPVAKRGAKGWTRFYRFSGEASCSFDAGGARVLDVLSTGRQTVIPPTMHPDGFEYVWISEETLDSLLTVEELPTLPLDFFERVEAVLKPFQTKHDHPARRRTAPPRDTDAVIHADLSIEGQYFRDLNAAALGNLPIWVPKLIPGAEERSDGYRCVATWRQCKNANVGIHHDGIRDWGGGYGMTAINLIMNANQVDFRQAAEALRALVVPPNVTPIEIRCTGRIALEGATIRKIRMVGDAATIQECLPVGQPEAGVKESLTPAPALAAPVSVPWAAMLAEGGDGAPDFLADAPGMLKTVAQWITETAPKAQPELSLAAAIALGATCTQRIYRSNLANFTSLYLVMIARSTEGKEHPQSCVERILTAAGLQNLVAGSGYTSAGAVFSALLRQPSHLAIIDEMGKLLKLSRSKGNANSEAAIDKLVEAFGKLGGVIRPPVYSTMSLPRGATAGDVRVIHNPAISLLGATTPATFYGSLTDDLVQDGFLGRLIVVESSLPRQLARFVDQTEPPEEAVQWCKAVATAPKPEGGNLSELSLAEIPAATVPMFVDEECRAILREFEKKLNVLKDRFEPEGLDVLLGRTIEKSLRLAMVATKAVDWRAGAVRPEILEWAMRYVEHYDMKLVQAVRQNRTANQTEADLKKLQKYVAGAAKYATDPKLENFAHVFRDGAVPRQFLLQRMHMKASEFNALVDTAVEAGMITRTTGAHLGYAGEIYYCNGG